MYRRTLVARLLFALALTAVVPQANAAPNHDPRDFRLINASSIVFVAVYVAPSSSNDWGDDIMGQDVLNPGETVTIHFSKFDGTTCYYDIKVTGPKGEEGELNQVDLCTIETVTFH